MKTWQTDSASLEATEALAEKIGKRLKGGEVIELVSDLGGGKTAFVRGLARGLGSRDHVASPTFTISREYQAGELTLYHFDFYRLSEPGIMSAELAEILDDPKAVVAVEWSDIVQHVLPEKRLSVKFALNGETSRQLDFTYPPELAYLIQTET
ncbi:MAG TPA: tRNA (adenosine(37)-N6)-threonylcarbamoyltransferase complex ATPase subunit type 1 TsaE [Candidatus Saccharimonadales bacterium]|jgi:tRNA threonylcarbamoyladenosine biosynthesis protein TsaE